jgi:hypothetical protein
MVNYFIYSINILQEHNIAQHSINDIKKLLRYNRLKPLEDDVNSRLKKNEKRHKEKEEWLKKQREEREREFQKH